MRPRNSVWSSKASSGSPSRKDTRLSRSGGPARTANTPALGRGEEGLCEQSPAAKMDGTDVWKLPLTRRKPAGSVSQGVEEDSQGAAAAFVHHTHSSKGSRVASDSLSSFWPEEEEWVEVAVRPL
jgi:hypothetical protein